MLSRQEDPSDAPVNYYTLIKPDNQNFSLPSSQQNTENQA